MAMWIVAGLDRRWQWSLPLPAWAVAAGWGLAIAGSAFVFWAMTNNRFFAAVVRIQTERGHTVQTGGPYTWVRHPGYAGATAFTLGLPLILGSRWTYVPAAVVVVLTLVRTALEDATLRRELAGYAAYASRVRYRLMPGIW
jgi:protein-S-isoprenylcysteine O-methyltransferase Ste14